MGKNKIVYPNYNNSILNLITSILHYYEVESKYKDLDVLKILNKKYKNIVLIILDGMGSNLLNNISPKGFFSKNKIGTITSVCPSTTTAALNTFYSGKPPIETGWIAWSQYFKEYGRSIDMFPRVDSYTGESYQNAKFDIYDLIKYKTVFEQIEEANKKIKAYEINPSHCYNNSKRSLRANDVQTMCDGILSLCNNKDNNFIFAYHDSPDKILHKEGCNSKEVKEFVLNSEKIIEKMCMKLKGTNTLVLISADHGHNDIDKTYSAIELDEINKYLIMPPSLESRFLGFWVKEDKKEEFEKNFKEKFKDEFVLYTKKELLEKRLLGEGNIHPKIDDFIGNYVAISTSGAIIKLGTHISEEQHEKLSTHCGLTENEMLVPLISYES